MPQGLFFAQLQVVRLRPKRYPVPQKAPEPFENALSVPAAFCTEGKPNGKAVLPMQCTPTDARLPYRLCLIFGASPAQGAQADAESVGGSSPEPL